MLFKLLKKLFGNNNVPIQTSIERMNWKDIQDITRETVGVGLVNSYHNSDNSYKLVDINTIKRFLAKNSVSNRKYVPTEHDCDDFSYILMGDVTRWDSDLAFGIIWGITPNEGGHAWNWFVGLDKKVWFIEPQHDKVFLPTEYWKTSMLLI